MTTTEASVPRVIGLDLSLTSTGIATNHEVTRIRTTGHTGDDLATRANRLHAIRNQILEWCKGAALVVIEAPAYSREHGSRHDRSGIWWMVVSRLVANQIPVAQVSPGSRAKYATGKGNAPKDIVMLAMAKRFPAFDVKGNDEADALALCAMGLDHLGWPLVILPDSHRVALKAVQWPVVMAS